MPIVHSHSALHCIETIINPGTNNYAAGYFAPVEVMRSALLTNFRQFIGFEKVPTLDVADGVVFEPLDKSKFSLPSNQTINTTQLSDIYTIFGWNFLNRADYHVGLGAVVVAPTGSRVKDEFIFQPIVGNGHHWELGGYFTSRYAFWHGCDDYNSWIFSLDAIVTHMFSAGQQRTLDIKNSCSSKYMLAQKINPPVGPFLFGNGSDTSGGPTASSTQPNAQFQNVYTPLANLTSACLKVSNDVQADIAAMLTYTTHHQSVAIDFGYDFWIKTKDKIKMVGSTALASGTWALKGDAYTYGFGATNAVIGADAIIPLSATESTATIHAGTNTPIGTSFVGTGANNQMQNPGVDNPQFGVTSNVIANTTDYINYAPGLVAAAANQQRISLEPIVLSDNDLDLDKEKKQALTHKFFIHGSYTWPQTCFWSPYVGFGGFVELAGRDMCGKSAAISQCGVWMKSGLSF